MNKKVKVHWEISIMADVDWSDDDAVHLFFNDDIDAENYFEGFGEGEFNIGNAKIIGEMPMDLFTPENDRDLPSDVHNGWSRQPRELIQAPFLEESKLNVNLDQYEAIDFFKLFINDDFIELMVQQTNLYAEQRSAGTVNPKPHSRQNKWSPVDIQQSWQR